MGPIEALERSRVVAIRRRLMAPKVAKEASEPRQVVLRPDPRLVPVEPEKPAVPVALDPTVPLETRREAIRRIISECAAKHRVHVSDLVGHDRSREAVCARHEAMFRMHVELNMSHAAIGLALGKNESTVVSGYKAHSGRSPTTAEVARRHAQKLKEQRDQERQLAIAAFNAGEINFSQAVALVRMTKKKARRLLAEQGIVSEQSGEENPLI